MNKNQDGFTLLELMVVVIIVGFFSMLAYKGYHEYVRYTYESKVKQETLKIMNSVQQKAVRTTSFNRIPKEQAETQVFSQKKDANGNPILYYSIKAYTQGGGTELSELNGNQAVDRVVVIARPEAVLDGKGYSLYYIDTRGNMCKTKDYSRLRNYAWNCGTASEEW